LINDCTFVLPFVQGYGSFRDTAGPVGFQKVSPDGLLELLPVLDGLPITPALEHLSAELLDELSGRSAEAADDRAGRGGGGLVSPHPAEPPTRR
jgi:hypothetical protein